MRWAICQLDDVYVAGTRGGGRLTRGARVDLDAEVSPGETYEQALGEFIQYFRLESPPPPPLTGLPEDADAQEPQQPVARVSQPVRRRDKDV